MIQRRCDTSATSMVLESTTYGMYLDRRCEQELTPTLIEISIQKFEI